MDFNGIKITAIQNLFEIKHYKTKTNITYLFHLTFMILRFFLNSNIKNDSSNSLINILIQLYQQNIFLIYQHLE